MMHGNIFDIKKYAIHDGQGIRTTVFLKGCPLHCVWCHNPEGIDGNIYLWHFSNKCLHCGECQKACRNGAIVLSQRDGSAIDIDHSRCLHCGNCVSACPTAALCFDGRTLSVDEVMNELMKDNIFYHRSAGGVTLSGGDPAYQPDFCVALLKRLKSANIHTAVETCLYASKEILESFIPLVDCFIVDIKLFCTREHAKYTGVDNQRILANFKTLARVHKHVLVRIPLIPGITAQEKNICDIAAFVKTYSRDVPIELINYNPLTQNKYRIMNQRYTAVKNPIPFSQDEMNRFSEMIHQFGLKTINP